MCQRRRLARASQLLAEVDAIMIYDSTVTNEQSPLPPSSSPPSPSPSSLATFLDTAASGRHSYDILSY